MKKILLAVFLVHLWFISAAYSFDNPSADFLLTGQGARAESMGQSVVSNCFDYTAIYWNPAAMAFLKKQEAGFHQASLPLNIKNSFLSFIKPCQYFAVGGTMFMETASGDSYDEQGKPLSSFNVNNSHFSLAGSLRVNNVLAAGVSVGYVNMQMGGYTSGTIDVSLSSIYVQNKFSAGIMLANFGGKLKFIEKKESLPALMRAGASVFLLDKKNLILSASITNVFENKAASFQGLGGEYLFNNFLSLRSGLMHKNSTLIPCLGLGIKYKMIGIDYAYTFNAASGLEGTEVNRLGISVNF